MYLGVSAEMVDHRRASGAVKQLPKIISFYNQHMGGVDILDQKVDQYAGERGFHKYWKKCFFGIIDRMVVCSYILYNENTSDTPKLSRFQFMCKLVDELCDTNVEDTLIPRTIPSEHRIIQLPAKKDDEDYWNTSSKINKLHFASIPSGLGLLSLLLLS